ncbi:MAG: hypothetical protein ILP02_04855, partial [Clostridia bacterium]|nr:hypothetical protein [Clostridia bacterium]
RDEVNQFYLKLTADPKAKSLYPVLPYSYAHPAKAAADLITEIAVLIAGRKTKIRRYDQDRLIALASYGLSFTSNLSGDMVKSFIVYGSLKVRRFFISKLLSQSVRNFDKMNIVEALALVGYDRRLDVVFDNIYLKIRLYKANFYGDNAKTFVSAYALAISRAFPFVKDLSAIKDAAQSVYDDLERKGKLKKIKNHKALAAAVVKISSVTKTDDKMLEKFFGTDKKAIDEVLDIIGEEQ